MMSNGSDDDDDDTLFDVDFYGIAFSPFIIFTTLCDEWKPSQENLIKANQNRQKREEEDE